jgi:predicted GTPase
MARKELLEEVRPLLDRAIGVFAGTSSAEDLQAARDRLDQPLRLAIAGKVKAGKSTLLNALVGEELAPTDEGECTKIVTWYRDGITYRVELQPKEGEPRQVPFAREDGAIEVDLVGTPPEAVERLVIDWPSSRLKDLTLIDTPGIGSLSADVSARAETFLTPGDDRVTDADAVLYLMKHLHTSDLGFLEAFHDEAVSQATPVNAIAVLSRADEVGVGRLDSLQSAATIADRYRRDPKVRRLAQTVVPVAGLLAQAGATVREVEYKAFADLAAVPEDERENLLLSADRFVNADTSSGLTSIEREALLDRFGLFGIRLSLHLITDQGVNSSRGLADRLTEASGLPELRSVLLSRFAERRDVLKARTGLLALDRAVRRADAPTGAADLADEVERITASAHEFGELQLLNALRTGLVVPKEGEVEDIERLLGTSGVSSAARLGLAEGASDDEVRQAAMAALARWQRKAENPLTSKDMSDASRVLVRACEAILASGLESAT